MSYKKIFITRAVGRLRFIENMDEVENICHDLGLEIVDNDKLTVNEQAELFSSCSLIVGIHGAGLTNMLFRESNCSIWEIFPPPDPENLPYHYFLLAEILHFKYRAVIGAAARKKYSGAFKVNGTALRSEIALLLRS